MYLGFDLGTSSMKAVVIDHSQNFCATAEVELTVSYTNGSWSEQHPRQWEAALSQVCLKLATQVPIDQIQRIGLTGQMHGATCLDKRGQVLRSCILWNDGRAGDECDELNAAGARFLDRSSNIAVPGFTAPKLMWLKAHEPRVFNEIATVLLPKDYLRFVLTGEFATDASDASGTLWLNPQSRQWDDGLIALSGANSDWLPDIFEGPEETGVVTARASKRFGLPCVLVVAGGGDNACAALALGISDAGQSFISLGSSGVFFTVSEAHRACPEKTVHAFAHALPNRWHQMTVTLSAASSLSWLSSIVGQSVEDLVHSLSTSKKIETEVQFLPYLNGERSPHNDRNVRGVFTNLSASTTTEDLCLAVMEGVSFSFCDGLEALEHAGPKIHSALSIGGGARSKYWLQIFANALNVIIETSENSMVGPSLGAARLALPDQDSAYLLEEVTTRFNPIEERADYYNSKLYAYRYIYQALKHLPAAMVKGHAQ